MSEQQSPKQKRSISPETTKRIFEVTGFFASVATIIGLVISLMNSNQDRANLTNFLYFLATAEASNGNEIPLNETKIAYNETLASSVPDFATLPVTTRTPTLTTEPSLTPSVTPSLAVDTATFSPIPSSTPEPSPKFSNVTADYSVRDYQGNPAEVVLRNGQMTGVDVLNVVDDKWIFSVGFNETNLILCTHPLTSTVESTFTIKVSNDKLRFSVRPHNSGDSYIEFWIDETLIYKEIISDKRWYTEELDLPVGTETVTLKHFATGWRYEYLYWSLLE